MRTRVPFVLVAAAGMFAATAGAQESQRESRHPHAYDIQPNSGNYAICVTSYMGDTAFQMAHDFVSELRATCNLPGYFFSRTEAERQQEQARRDAQKQQRLEFYKQMGLEPPEKFKYQKVKIEDQYAVLICAPAFKDLDTTRKHLDTIRKLDPKRFARLLHTHTLGAEGGQGGEIRERENPFLTAFVVPNPAAPKPKPAAEEKRQELSLRDWNADEKYSAIHKIPGKWTLIVRVYRPAVHVVSQFQDRSAVEGSGNGGRQGNLMDANSKMAHQLAEVLRNPQLGFDAYVIHMPKMSMVTVGAFDAKDDSRMSAVATSLSKLHLNLQGGAAGAEELGSPTVWQVPTR